MRNWIARIFKRTPEPPPPCHRRIIVKVGDQVVVAGECEQLAQMAEILTSRADRIVIQLREHV